MSLSNEIGEKLLSNIGCDINNSELKDTPKRFLNAILQMTQSNRNEINTNILIKFKNDSSNNIITIKNIHCKSLCKHHIMPFFGKIQIKYIPDKYILGLSKFNVIVNYFSKKLQTQEGITNDVCNFIQNYLQPKGVNIISEMNHTCITNRGVEDTNSITIVEKSTGCFIR